MNEGDYFRGYRLKRELGRGSYGDVWLAEKQMDFGGASVYYALKFLRTRNEEGIDIEKVIREIVAWTRASSHPNVISIRDSFTAHGKYVIVSDFADGGSLKGRSFSFEEAVRFIEDVLNGIEYLHALPMIHRDIKPENILLKNGVACISDFGLAREFDKTQSMGLGGSINYFSPEMAKKELGYEAHERTPLDDLWATAVTFYQLLTGELPFKKMGHIIKGQREPLPESCPPEFKEFFDKTFHKNRTRRFESAKKMREEIRRIVYPQARLENKIEELKERSSVLQIKLGETQNYANLLYKTVAEERIKTRQLTTAKAELEKRSAAETENSRILRSELAVLRDELQSLHDRLEKTDAENSKLKKHLRVLKKRYAPPFAKKPDNGVRASLSGHLEKSFFEAGDDFLNKKEYDQAICHFTEAIKLNSRNASAYFKRGVAYNGRGAAFGKTEDYDRAIRDYYQATFLNGSEIKIFRGGNPAAIFESAARRPLPAADAPPPRSVKDYKRLLKLHPIFNNAFEALTRAKQKRRVDVLKFILKWAALLLAFSGLYISAYKFIRPAAAQTASLLSRTFYDLGLIGENTIFVVLSAAGIALSALLVIGLAVFLKNVLTGHMPENVIFTAFCAAGLLLSGYVFYSFYHPAEGRRAADRDEKTAGLRMVEKYSAGGRL